MVNAIAVCTRNRPKSLQNLINSINRSSLGSEILVVCDSSFNEFKEKIQSIVGEFKGNKTYILHSVPGVSYQRNILLTFALMNKIKLLYYLDDDVEIDSDYFKVVQSVFNSDSELGIVGTSVINENQRKFKGSKQGVLQKNGVAHGVYNLSGERYVDWVPGLSMTLNVLKLDDLWFDEKRIGNSIGEDLDFCLRARETSKILWTDKTCIKHFSDPYGRYTLKKNIYATYYHRHLLLKEFPKRVVRYRLLLRIGLEILVDLFRFIIKLNLEYLHKTYYRILYLFESKCFSQDIKNINKILVNV